jgi:NTP pyrophosphatase (non-canonical NTP hydrolase)
MAAFGFSTTQWDQEYLEYIRDFIIYPKGQGEVESEDGRLVTIYLEESYLLPALIGEVGELSSIYAKAVRDREGDIGDEDIQNIRKELGDILFMLTALASLYGYDLKYIAEQNVAKLLDRKKRNVLSGSGDNR